MKYMILTRAGFAVAVPSDWKTAGAFKRLQRIVNFTVKPSDVGEAKAYFHPQRI